VLATLHVPARLGLHARPCAVIARLVQGSHSHVTIAWQGKSADAGSIIELLTLGVPGGATIEVVATGRDADSTIRALTRLVENAGNYDA
jgi:phosphotransferase system HPr (HPr) family protein